MEADRMGWMLPVLTASRFETQRGVVLNERRQNYENRPYGLAQMTIARAVYPPDHPYAWPTIGEAADLEAATLGDARAFFASYYHPGNASLAIAGDIAAGEAFELADGYFGDIARGPAVPAVSCQSVEARPSSSVLEDRVDLPRLYLTWPSPALFAAGDAELDLAGDLVGNGRTSRLYRRLIHDRRIATEIMAGQSSRELGSLFQIVATAAPGVSLRDVHTAIVEELEAVRASGPGEDEMARGRAQAEAAFVYRVQTLGGFGGRTDQLNAYNVYLGQPDSFDADLKRYVEATPGQVRDALGTWVDPARAAVLSVVPEGNPGLGLQLP
jgi:zinc protease